MKKTRSTKPGAFTLVEVTLALGIAAFCLIALLGLLPASVNSSNNATEETAAMNGVAGLVADLKTTPPTATGSPLYGIPLTSGTLYFNDAWQKVTTVAGARYRVTTIATPAGSVTPARATLHVSWPAAVTPQNATGSVTVFAAYNSQ